MEVLVNTTLFVGLAFLLTILILGFQFVSYAKKNEATTNRIKAVAAPRSNDLEWSVFHTTAAFIAQNQEMKTE